MNWELLDSDDPRNYQPKPIFRNGRPYNITGLNPYWKRRNFPGNYAKSAHPPTRKKPVQISKFTLYKIIKRFHEYKHKPGTNKIKSFQRHYRYKRSRHKKYISMLSHHTWKGYSAKYKVESEKFQELHNYIFNNANSKKQIHNKKRFYTDPATEQFGAAPILEEFLLKKRNIVQEESGHRGIDWMINAAQHAVSNERLFELLTPLMTTTEKKAIPAMTFTKGYIYKIINRHHLNNRASTSNRKLTEEQYVAARVKYLLKEREFRRHINVIVPRPDNYDVHYEEIWPDDVEEIWDATREFNLDEVPFVIDPKTKQIVERNSKRCSIFKNNPFRYGKYRQGTLVIISNFEQILFILIIFNKGGPRVRNQLKNQMIGNLETQVFWDCSPRGNMTAYLWRETLNMFKNLTFHLRGCTNSCTGQDWTKAIVLNSDNYGVHLNKEIAADYAKKYGIYLRFSIRNASHIQQPVDQHVGVLVKDLVKHNLKKLLHNHQQFISFGQDITLRKHKWRQIVARFVHQALTDINLHAKDCLCIAWINYGLFLSTKSGDENNRDGDIKSLHCQKYNSDHTRYWRSERTRNLKNIVTIKTRDEWKNPHIWTKPHNIQYNVHAAVVNGYVNLQPRANLIWMLKNDLTKIEKKTVHTYRSQFDADLSNLDNKLTTDPTAITPYDVIALQQLYDNHDDTKNMSKNLFLNKLGIPLRDKQAKLIRMPTSGRFNLYISMFFWTNRIIYFNVFLNQ